MVLIRRETRDDIDAVAQLRVASWHAAYAELIDARVLAGLDAESDARHWHDIWQDWLGDELRAAFVAVDGAQILGWASAGPARHTSDATVGELYALYVAQEAWSTGAGHALLEAVEAHLRKYGYETATLEVLQGNARAERFYERHGWREDGTETLDERYVDGELVQTLVDRRRVCDLRESTPPAV